MRALVRGLIVWLIGFPLSVFVSSAIVASIFLVSALVANDAKSLVQAQRTFFDVWPVVAFFSALPVLITWIQARPDRQPLRYFVRSGARTGFWCGVIAMIAFIPFALLASVAALATLFGAGDPEAQAMAQMVIVVAGIIGAFTIAGAAGGAAFGATSRFASLAV